jgi:hypothetical protein
MEIKISIPNDYNSEDSYKAAVEDCYDGDDEACISDEGQRLYEALADAASAAGLKFVEGTDFGAIWWGTPRQIKECRKLLPGWAYVGEVD